MNRLDIIRAWKDADYRESLSDAERAALPENPAGLMELPEAALGNVAGGGPLPTMTARPATQVHCPSHRPGGCQPTHRVGCQGTIYWRVTQVHCPSHRPGGCQPTHRVGCQGTIYLFP